MTFLAIFGGAPGPWEILLVLFVVLLLFGSRKLPELARSLGKSLSEFRKGREEGETAARLDAHQEQNGKPEDGASGHNAQ